MTRLAAASAIGSAGVTWKSIVSTKRPSASAPPRPAAMPAAARTSDSRCTIHSTDAGRAPSAMRRPISRPCRDTA